MISDDLMTIRKFIHAMRDTDAGNGLHINAENTDYLIGALTNASDRVRSLECMIVPPALRDCPVANDGTDGSNGAVVSFAAYRSQNPKRKTKQ